MQDPIELAKVKAFYYQKVVELGSYDKAAAFIDLKTHDSSEWKNMSWFCDIRGRELIFRPELIYRIKPETVTHPGGEYPKPLTMDDVEREGIITIFIPIPRAKGSVCSYTTYRADIWDISGLVRGGLAHKTKEAAIEHAKVLFQTDE